MATIGTVACLAIAGIAMLARARFKARAYHRQQMTANAMRSMGTD